MQDFAKQCIASLVLQRKNLTRSETKKLFRLIMEGALTPSQIGALLVALKMKGETAEEIASAAEVMRVFAVKIPYARIRGLVDTCGTGGDRTQTFNISTVSAFVARGAGVMIAKHGNRSVSSKCGSADLLESLGVSLALSPQKTAACLNTLGIAFLFAPLYHPATSHVKEIRKELGVRTIFNILGPLTNPAHAQQQVIGVYARDLMEKMAKALALLGVSHALIVHGKDGMDEITTTGYTFVAELKNRTISTYTIHPRQFGLNTVSLDVLRAASPKASQRIACGVLQGKKGPARDIVLLNAAAAIYVGGKADSLAEGIVRAEESIDQGYALRALEALRRYTNR